MTPEPQLSPPYCYAPENVPADTARKADEIITMLSAAPDMATVSPQVIRDRREQGLGPFPMPAASPRAETLMIDGPHGAIPLRIIAPDEPKGVYLHFHGGGWMLGAAHHQDDRLERLAENCGLASVSVDYRLAPEHPYPQGPDDCEAAARWLIDQAETRFGTKRLFIGGESAGAHLSAITLLRLRDRHGLTPFAGANLVAGCYDLSLTPSVQNWGDEKLILNTNDVHHFVDRFITGEENLRDPDISPLYADLAGLPPALFTVGTRDLLLDDSLFMAARWQAASNDATIDIYPGAMHVFTAYPDLTQAEMALQRAEQFMAELI